MTRNHLETQPRSVFQLAFHPKVQRFLENLMSAEVAYKQSPVVVFFFFWWGAIFPEMIEAVSYFREAIDVWPVI